jgi:hypothetical protein
MVHLERTFQEYRDSFFAKAGADSAETCQGCHMPGLQTGPIAEVKGVGGARRVHEHLWPGVDVPLTDFPNRDVLKAGVEQCALAQSIQFFDFQADTNGLGRFAVILETSAGHNQPSGASQDRRMWLQITAYDQTGAKIFETGNIADDAIEMNSDPSIPLTFFNDKIFDADGKEAHMFWDAAKSTQHPDGYEAHSLPRPQSLVPGSHSLTVPLQLGVPIPSKVEVRVRMRPMGLDVLHDLVDSGDLDAGLLQQVPTFTMYSADINWKKDANDPSQFTITVNTTPDCKTYTCMIDPQADACTD